MKVEMSNPDLRTLYKLLPMEYSEYKKLLEENEGKFMPFVKIEDRKVSIRVMGIENGRIKMYDLETDKNMDKKLKRELDYEFVEEFEQGLEGFFYLPNRIFEIIKNLEVI